MLVTQVTCRKKVDGKSKIRYVMVTLYCLIGEI